MTEALTEMWGHGNEPVLCEEACCCKMFWKLACWHTLIYNMGIGEEAMFRATLIYGCRWHT